MPRATVLGRFLAALTKQAIVLIAGGLFTIAGWLWNLLRALFPILQESSWSGATLWIPGHVLIFFAAYYAWRDEHTRRLAAEAHLERRVRLHHQYEGSPNYLRVATMGPGVRERRHIIGVENLSAKEIDGLNIVAESFEPYLQGVTWVDAPMHPLRAPIDKEGRFTLSVGDGQPTRFVEVFQEIVFTDSPSQLPLLTFVYDQSGLQNLRRFIVGDWFACTFRIQGPITPERIRLVARRNFEANVWDIKASEEQMPTSHNCTVVALQSPSAGTPAVEPVSDATPSHALGE